MSDIIDQRRILEESFGRDVERAYVKKCVITKVTLDDGEPYLSVRPIHQREYIDRGGERVFQDSAEVLDVPIAYHSSSKFAHWIPPEEGDFGDLVYQDTAFDKWWIEGGDSIEPGNTRKRNRTDCIFYPGGWSKVEFMDQASDEWHEMRNMLNNLRVAISDSQGVHLQHEEWSLILRNSGFDVFGQGVSLMEQLETGFTATAAGFLSSAAGFAALGQGGAAAGCAAAAAQIEAVVLELAAIKGSSSDVIREEGTQNR